MIHLLEPLPLRSAARHIHTASRERRGRSLASTACTYADSAVNLPHETVTECLRALEREQLATIRRYKALTEKKAQLVREFLQIYENVLKNSTALNGVADSLLDSLWRR